MTTPGHACAGAGLSTRPDTRSALREALEETASQVGAHPDLAVLFLTGEHAGRAGAVADEVAGRLAPDAWIGIPAPGVIGGGAEVQTGQGVAVWAARMPGARVQAFHLELRDEGEERYVRGWPRLGPDAGVGLVADVFSFPIGPFLASLRQSGEAPRIFGGLAGSGPPPERTTFLLDGEAKAGGAVGFAVDGSVSLLPLVSQGCRPVGPAFQVTRSERNVIYELDGAPAYDGLRQVLERMDDEARRDFASSPQIGLRKAASGGEDPGAFLIRNLVGADPEEGTVVVGDHVRDGFTVRFHARDAGSAHREFEEMLALASSLHPEPLGGLLFDCTGRGLHLFDEPHHDAALVQRYFPGLPLAGMFAAGEIGPVQGQPQIHGFTASLGLLVPAS